MPSRIDNAKYWRDRSEETVAIAEQMDHVETKKILLGIAHGYAQLARLACLGQAGRQGFSAK